MSVQCNAMQNSSIVQFSTAVGCLTKKYKEVKKKSCFRAKILQEALEVQELHRKKVCNYDFFNQFLLIFVFKRSSKIEREKIIGVETF